MVGKRNGRPGPSYPCDGKVAGVFLFLSPIVELQRPVGPCGAAEMRYSICFGRSGNFTMTLNR
jgi:hypothetical protein